MSMKSVSSQLKPFKTSAAYTACVLLLNFRSFAEKEMWSFKELRDLFALSEDGLIDLLKEKLIHFNDFKIGFDFVLEVNQARREGLELVARKVIATQGFSKDLSKEQADIHRLYDCENLFGHDRYQKLSSDRFLPIQIDELFNIRMDFPISPIPYVSGRLKLDPNVLKKFLKDYAKSFANDELDSNGLDIFSYANHRELILATIQSKLKSGLSANNLILNEDEIWERKFDTAFKVRYVEALLALEVEGILALKNLYDRNVTSEIPAVVTLRNPRNFCTLEAQIRVLKSEYFQMQNTQEKQNLSLADKSQGDLKLKLFFNGEKDTVTFGALVKPIRRGTKMRALVEMMSANKNTPFSPDNIAHHCNENISSNGRHFKAHKDIRDSVRDLRAKLGVSKGDIFPIRSEKRGNKQIWIWHE